jgi:hypothetical protein
VQVEYINSKPPHKKMRTLQADGSGFSRSQAPSETYGHRDEQHEHLTFCAYFSQYHVARGKPSEWHLQRMLCKDQAGNIVVPRDQGTFDHTTWIPRFDDPHPDDVEGFAYAQLLRTTPFRHESDLLLDGSHLLKALEVNAFGVETPRLNGFKEVSICLIGNAVVMYVGVPPCCCPLAFFACHKLLIDAMVASTYISVSHLEYSLFWAAGLGAGCAGVLLPQLHQQR